MIDEELHFVLGRLGKVMLLVSLVWRVARLGSFWNVWREGLLTVCFVGIGHADVGVVGVWVGGTVSVIGVVVVGVVGVWVLVVRLV